MFLTLRFYRTLLIALTWLLPCLAFYLGYWMWLSFSINLQRPVAYPLTGHAGLILISTFVWAFMAERYRVTNVDELFRERTGARGAVSAVLAATLVLLAISFFSRDDVFPRGLFVTGIFVLLALAVFMRAVFRTLVRQTRKWAPPSQVLIIGADAFARQAAERLQRLSFAPCRIAGYVCLPGQTPAVNGAPLYRSHQISELNANQGFNEVIIAIHPAEFARIPEIVQPLERLSLPARAVVDLGEGVVVRDRLFQLGRMQMLDLTRTPADSLDYALLKRAFDIGFSLVVLVLASPLFLLIALLVRLTSPGPIFFFQDRVGLNGKTFRMYKFRTMKVPRQDESDSVWTIAKDPRRTSFGTLLRATSLDELPQFYNVLRGDMSVVGPRPERPHFAKKFLHNIARYNTRHCLKVGITGWAQVNGWRGDTSIEKRVEHDLYYLQNWSMGLDLRIIGLTLLSGLIHKNAY